MRLKSAASHVDARANVELCKIFAAKYVRDEEAMRCSARCSARCSEADRRLILRRVTFRIGIAVISYLRQASSSILLRPLRYLIYLNRDFMSDEFSVS